MAENMLSMSIFPGTFLVKQKIAEKHSSSETTGGHSHNYSVNGDQCLHSYAYIYPQ